MNSLPKPLTRDHTRATVEVIATTGTLPATPRCRHIAEETLFQATIAWYVVRIIVLSAWPSRVSPAAKLRSYFATGRRRRNGEQSSKLAMRKLDMVDAATRLNDLLSSRHGDPRLEALSGQWRECFRWTDEGPAGVEIVDYH